MKKIVIQTGNPLKLINVSPTSFYFPERYILHPKLQVEFIETLLRDAYTNDKFRKHFCQDDIIFITTNSEHIINTCRVARKENKVKSVEIQFFPFYETECKSKDYIEIRVDKNGALDSYPKDFMDELSNQLLKLM